MKAALYCLFLVPGLVLVGCAPQSMVPPSAQPGSVVKVVDGDTLLVTVSGYEPRLVQLAGIDAPELKQALGPKARQRLALWTGRGEIRIQFLDNSPGEALVFVDQHDVRVKLLEEGLAWVRTGEQNPELVMAFEEGRNRRAGVWSEANTMTPGQFRAQSAESSSQLSEKRVASSRLSHQEQLRCKMMDRQLEQARNSVNGCRQRYGPDQNACLSALVRYNSIKDQHAYCS